MSKKIVIMRHATTNVVALSIPHRVMLGVTSKAGAGIAILDNHRNTYGRFEDIRGTLPN
jgi:hypothetical protein